MIYISKNYHGHLPEVDITNVQGNASDDAKRFTWSIFKLFLGGSGWFGGPVGKHIEFVEANVWEETASEPAKAQTVFEVEVTKDMCNPFGILHGACAAYFIDHCSISATVALGTLVGKDGVGLSQNMNITWHEGPPIGSILRIVNTSTILRGRQRAARTEIWNGKKLCISGSQSLINVPNKMVLANAKPPRTPGGFDSPRPERIIEMARL